jgi:hypothetical protein
MKESVSKAATARNRDRKPMLCCICSFTFLSFNPVWAQNWTQTSAPQNTWNAIAMSADGTKLAAVAGIGFGGDGLIYTSTDSGKTWIATSAPFRNWTAVASSADGTKVVAAAADDSTGSGELYTSVDFGSTWVMRTNLLFRSLASSADGTIVVAGSTSSWISTDSGATWSANAGLGGSCFASSADGTMLESADWRGIFVSTNTGLNWRFAFSAPGSLVDCLASSADGTKLAAGVEMCPCIGGQPGPIFVSRNGGLTWVATSTPATEWASIACSSDGNKLVAADFNAGVYMSTDVGASWTNTLGITSGLRSSVASSADGSKVAAALYGDGIWVSQTTPVPVARVTRWGINLLISWTIPSTVFRLQENTDVTSTNWTDVLAVPIPNFTNLQYEVSVSPTHRSRFYRLKD